MHKEIEVQFRRNWMLLELMLLEDMDRGQPYIKLYLTKQERELYSDMNEATFELYMEATRNNALLQKLYKQVYLFMENIIITAYII